MKETAGPDGVPPCLACGAPWLPDLSLAFGGRCSAGCWESDLEAYLRGTERRSTLLLDNGSHEGR